MNIDVAVLEFFAPAIYSLRFVVLTFQRLQGGQCSRSFAEVKIGSNVNIIRPVKISETIRYSILSISLKFLDVSSIKSIE